MDHDSSPISASAAVTVRGLAPELKARLRIRAAHNARSMEAEARAILETALSAPDEDATDLASFARGLFAPLGGVDLELSPRERAREPPMFGVDHEPATSLEPAPKPVTTPRPVKQPVATQPARVPTRGRGRRA